MEHPTRYRLHDNMLTTDVRISVAVHIGERSKISVEVELSDVTGSYLKHMNSALYNRNRCTSAIVAIVLESPLFRTLDNNVARRHTNTESR